MKNKKMLLIILVIAIVLCLTACLVVIILHNNEKNSVQSDNVQTAEKEENYSQEDVNKVDIIDENSKTRPYAIVINNTPVAVKVQTGLNKAYLVYEIPTEGNTSRLMALYKDVEEDFTIGTIRSSRHNFIDYALESDAIFIHYGWSHYAQDDEKKGSINFINGLFDAPFWRDNPENLASEHTAYTSIAKLKENIKNKGFETEANDTILLNYNVEDVNLSQYSNSRQAKKVDIKYGGYGNITTFEYDETNKIYYRMEDNNYCIDHKTKEKVNTKNIIVQKINYSVCSDNKYWDLKTIGSGEGYFITNGYAVPITWKKDSRKGKTKYYYKDGTEIEVSDGRTYIEIETTNQGLDIE